MSNQAWAKAHNKAYMLLAVVFVMLLAAAEPACADVGILAPAGTQAYSFSIDVKASESEPFAGIQYGLALSDEGTLRFDSFTLGDAVKDANSYPIVYAHGVHSFGFWTGANTYQGDMEVGTLNFTYTGESPQTISINEMMIVRITGGKTEGTNITSPAYLYTANVSRDTDAGGGNGNGNNNGNGNGNGDSDNGDVAYTGGTSNPGAGLVGAGLANAGNAGGSGAPNNADGSGLTSLDAGSVPLGGLESSSGYTSLPNQATPLGSLPRTGDIGAFAPIWILALLLPGIAAIIALRHSRSKTR